MILLYLSDMSKGNRDLMLSAAGLDSAIGSRSLKVVAHTTVACLFRPGAFHPCWR